VKQEAEPMKTEEQIHREELAHEGAHILHLEGLSTAELHELAQAAWETYRDKHLALRGGDEAQIRALEGPDGYLWALQWVDAASLARVLAVLWERGENWSPVEPVLVPAE
jgi:hypothetical protein